MTDLILLSLVMALVVMVLFHEFRLQQLYNHLLDVIRILNGKDSP